MARPRTADAKRADAAAIAEDQWMTRIEANPGIARDVRIVCESVVHERVADDERSALEYGMTAERVVSKHLAKLQSEARFELFAIPIHQCDQRDGNVEQRGGDARDAIEAFLGRRVPQAERSGCGEPTALVVGLLRSRPAAGRTHEPSSDPRSRV